jgi:sporulation protein YlmC with PRC-barrel domain
MARDKRGHRDLAGVGPDPDSSRRRLISLSDLDGFSIGDGEPDIRGWEVRTVGGRELGEVEDLLVDPDRGEVVMIEVDVRGESVHAEVPIRSVQLDRKHKHVIVDSGDLSGTPRNAARARDRMDETERTELRTQYGSTPRDVRYAGRDRDVDEDSALTTEADETVIERRPIVEEVVVRRRPADEE